jgi:Exo-beta-D-glucosaminidase Ig-fold domain
VDLGAVYTVDKVDLTWGAAIAKIFAFQTSLDGTTWATARTVTIGELQLVKLQLHDADAKLRSDNRYWYYGTAQDLQALNSLQPATIAAKFTGREQANGRVTVAVQLTNSGRSVAAMVVLSLRQAATGERVLPGFYSDNYFWLFPGEARAVTVECSATDLGAAAPAVQLFAYNSSPQMITA